ncbi:MAG: HEAT repeat domain-containing protein [Candidatus Acidiferrales bacterium]
MQHDQHDKMAAEICKGFEEKWTLFAAGELHAWEVAEMKGHLVECERCNETLAQENALVALLSSNRTEPGAALLAGCRASLEDALDREEEHGWLRRTVGALLPTSWISPAPAWSAALLLLIGFSVGMLGPRLLQHRVTTSTSQTPDTPTKLDFHTAKMAVMTVAPSGANEPPEVDVQLNAQRPVTMHGTVNNEDVKDFLMFVLHNNQRFDADVRMNAVDLLRARNKDADVRSALCQTVHTDHNAAVRLKALEALDGAEPQDIIQQTLLDALVDDQNPGVRVEAINALRAMAAKGQVESDDHLISVLRERMHKDPSTYIRLQSAAAIQDLGPRQKF